MAKPLQKTPPTSAVVGLFDREAANRATAAIAEPLTTSVEPFPSANMALATEPAVGYAGLAAVANRPTGEPANVVREFVLSRSAERSFNQLLELFRQRTGTRLTGSHLARAMLKGVAHAMVSIRARIAAPGAA